jgi:hypothetical protein
MVAKITTGKSIRGMLLYNENKVAAGEAKLILSSGFAGDTDKMNFHQKLQRFNHLTELKPNVKTNAMHISLNFHGSDQLDNLKLQQIARDYMEKIGFADQPFLVYRHQDAAHPHLHIATTNITAEARRIDLHDIGRLLSEPARKAIEVEYKLVQAEGRGTDQEIKIKQADPEKAQYGKSLTKQSLNNVITAVFRDYRFTSLAEYNAVLKCFNVVAFRGGEHTAMYERKGLMYSLLDKHGKQVGVPIKSSAFYSKPTLNNLEKKFEANIEKRKGGKEDLKNRVDQVIKDKAVTREQFQREAEKQGIHVAFRENEQGRIFGITFVDHKNKVVYNGSDLGKPYSANAITGRFTAQDFKLKDEQKVELKPEKGKKVTAKAADSFAKVQRQVKLMDIALAKTSEDGGIKIPKPKKKRRKKRNINHELNL